MNKVIIIHMINPVYGADCTIYQDKDKQHFYLVATKDDGHKHFVIYESDDMYNWKEVGYALDDLDINNWGEDWFWAPEIYFNPNNGFYYLFYSARVVKSLVKEYFYRDLYDECCKIGVAVSKSPKGPFKNITNRPIDYYPFNDAHLNIEQKVDNFFELRKQDNEVSKGEYVSMIDANLFIDEDNRTYLYYSLCCYHNATWDNNLSKYIEESNIAVVELNNNFWFSKEPIMPEIISENKRVIDGMRKDIFTNVINYHSDPQEWENSHVSDYDNKIGGQRNRRWSEGSTTFVKYLNNKKYYCMTYSCNHYANPYYGVGIAFSDKPTENFKKSLQNPIISSKNNINFCSLGHGSILEINDKTYYFHHGRITKEDERSLFVSEIKINSITDIEVGPATQLKLLKN